MSKEMVIATSPHETKVAILEDGQAVEVSIEREKESGLVGSIYKGRVTRVLPGMQSAFIDIGLERDAFLYVSDFFEDLEEYERILASAEEGMPLAAAEPAAASEVELAPGTAVLPLEASPGAPAPRERPERRRLGRRSHRSRRTHYRGYGRGRGLRRFEPTTRVTEAAHEPKPCEPLILPGESLAKYKDRVPVPAAEPESPPERPADAVAGDRSAATPEPAEPATEQSKAPVELAPPSAEVELPAQPEPLTTQPEAEVPTQVTPVSEVTPPKPSSDYIAVEEVTGEELQPATRAEPAEAYVEVPEEPRASELRVVEENSGVTLPPSVRERTAGGVEWEELRGVRPRERRRRGRRRRRPATGVQPRAKISELLHPGQEVIVQIIKEQIGTKGARILSLIHI